MLLFVLTFIQLALIHLEKCQTLQIVIQINCQIVDKNYLT